MADFLTEAGRYLAGETALSVYWAFAWAGTILFALSVLFHLFCGGSPADGDSMMDDMELDHPDTGFPDLKFLSFRTILAFFTMFGWGGVVFGEHGLLGLLAAILCGAVMMVITAFVIAGLLKLQESGTVSSQSLVGKSGTVYLTIPAGRRAAGKVSLNLGTATREVQAVSDDEIPTGSPVVLQEYLGSGKYLAVESK